MKQYWCVVIFCAFSLAAPVQASVSVDMAMEQTAHALGRELRCPVCENDTIEDSQTSLAADLRAIIRAQLAAGKSPQEIKTWLASRYGEKILLEPELSAQNLLLWLAPALLLLLGGYGVYSAIRKKP
ncbi:MAG: cytochrome c-type biogenesis protein [Alphaproteobacteria bacterium]